MDNTLIKELALLTANSYKEYYAQNENCELIADLKAKNLYSKYIVLDAKKNVEQDGMEAVAGRLGFNPAPIGEKAA